MNEQDIFSTIRARVLAALAALVPDLPAELAARVEVQPARDPAHGDMATNAAMVSARAAGRKPAALAADLARALSGGAMIVSAEPAGPGFVNLRLAPAAFHAVLSTALRLGPAFGDSVLGAGQAVNVEYVSANPTGPMHIGHCRGAVVGDALATLLGKTGFAVTREYYINDAGAQVVALAWATYWRYLQALGTAMTEEDYAAIVPGGLQYRGEYLIPVGEVLAATHGPALAGPGAMPAPAGLWLDIVRETAVTMMMEAIREDLALLGVAPDVFTSERALVASGAVDGAIARLDAQGLIYEGVLDPPRGKTPEDWEPRPQTLFRATEFGDDVDRPLRKSDGSNTYFSNDIAYHADKAGRGFPLLIDVWGADHGGYVARMAAAVKAITGGTAKLEVVLCQIVRILRAGQPVRMSKRAGSYVTLRDLIEEVGRDAVRFTMMMRKSDAQMDFDLDQALAQTRENPVFYVQYAHARCCSVLRAAREADLLADEAALAEADLSALTAEPELALIRRMAAFPRLLEGAALAREPHRIAFFLYDLASDFHMLWNRGKDDSALRFIQAEKPDETRARLALVAATIVVLRAGLAVLGVTPMDELR